jgi:hypothetical protein
MEKEIIKEAVQEALTEFMEHHTSFCKCNLEVAGIPPFTHQEHHRLFAALLTDLGKIRLTLVSGLILAGISGLATLLWLGFRHKLGV